MEKTDIIKALLSKDEAKLTEAKTALKALLDSRANKFKEDGTKFLARSLFETKETI